MSLLLMAAPAAANEAAASAVSERPRPWFERLAVRGYVQFREQWTLAGDPDLVSDQDRSVGPVGTFSFRRARVILYGDLSDRVYLYLQPDFAVQAGASDGSVNFGQLRDLYVDVTLDDQRESRLRFGQSKVPFGFENLQSSQNRLPLDRADVMSSGVKDDRDMGVFYMWAPAEIRKRFKTLVDSGLRGSGDYGALAFGAYSGQGANRPDANSDVHLVARGTWPFELPGGQIVEGSLQGYRGRYVVRTSSSAVQVEEPTGILDERAVVSAIWYPQPFGLQAEYCTGQGPALDPSGTRVRKAPLQGGYVQAMCRLETPHGGVTPFVRWQVYDGGKKAEKDAPLAHVKDLETGLEWRPSRELEVTLAHAFMNRTNVLAAPYVQQQGQVVRTQVQWNF